MARPTAWLAVVVLLAGCAGEPDATAPEAAAPATPATPGPPATAAPDQTTPPVPAQLDFTLPELGGGQVVGAELAGRHVALWFWTPW